MDLVLFCLFVAWVSMRYVAGDTIAAVRGTESARTRDRAARQQLAQQRTGGGPTVGQALTNRVAQRIANPPNREAGPLRNWLAEWWDDMWAEATERRLRARQRRFDRQAEQDRKRHEQRRQPPPPPPPDEEDPEIIDAEVVDPPAEPDPDPEPEEQPPVDEPPAPPPPAPDQPDQPEEHDPLRKEPDMTTSSDLSGETYNPATASAFALGCKNVTDDVIVQIEQSIAALESQGVSGGPIEHLEQMKESYSIAAAHAGEANVYFESHIGTRDVIASDGTLDGTQTDGYLDPAAA